MEFTLARMLIYGVLLATFFITQGLCLCKSFWPKFKLLYTPTTQRTPKAIERSSSVRKTTNWLNLLSIASWLGGGVFSAHISPKFQVYLGCMTLASQAFLRTALEFQVPNTYRLSRTWEGFQEGTINIDGVEVILVLPGLYLLFAEGAQLIVRTSLAMGFVVIAFFLGPLQAYIAAAIQTSEQLRHLGFNALGRSRILGFQRVFWVGILTVLCNFARMVFLTGWTFTIALMLSDLLIEHFNASQPVAIAIAISIVSISLLPPLFYCFRHQLVLLWKILFRFTDMLELIGAHNIPTVDFARSHAFWVDGVVPNVPDLASRFLLSKISTAVLQSLCFADVTSDVSRVANEAIANWRVELLLDTEQQGTSKLLNQLAKLYGYAPIFIDFYSARDEAGRPRGLTLYQTFMNINALLTYAAGLDGTQGADRRLVDRPLMLSRSSWASAGGRAVTQADNLHEDSERARQLLEFTAYTFRPPGQL